MKSVLLTLVAMLMPVAAQAEETMTDPKAWCEQQANECTQHCSRQKTLGLFKGEAWKRCTSNCDESEKSCLAEELDVDEFEVIVARTASLDPA